MKKFYAITIIFLLILSACSKDSNTPFEEEQQDLPPGEITYTIINNGNAGVNSVIDSQDNQPWTVAQAIPSVQGDSYSNKLPIILFLDDKILISSLTNNIEVTEDGTELGGTLSINEGANGYAILTFTPTVSFNSGTTVVFTLFDGVQDDGGNNFFSGNFSLTYNTIASSNGDFNTNGSFENNTEGVQFLGDGNILEGTQGCVEPLSGSNMAGITSGNSLISNNNSIGNASSIMILGPVTNEFTNVSFSYNFLSTEFQEFVDSEFDDSVIVTAVGPNGSRTVFLTSVNTVGIDGNTQCFGFPGLPDDGDDYAGATGWKNETIDINHIGSPAFLIFTITDVADTIFSSALTVDNVSFD